MQLYMSWYIRSFFGFTFLNILYFFKYSCTNIFHRCSLYTFYQRQNIKLKIQDNKQNQNLCVWNKQFNIAAVDSWNKMRKLTGSISSILVKLHQSALSCTTDRYPEFCGMFYFLNIYQFSILDISYAYEIHEKNIHKSKHPTMTRQNNPILCNTSHLVNQFLKTNQLTCSDISLANKIKLQ